jgi:hypothetical protein
LKILLDESVPVQVRLALPAHDVSTVSGLGWKGLENGALLAAAARSGFDVLVIADKNHRYQQNLSTLGIALVELWMNHRPTLERHFDHIASSIAGVTSGTYLIVPSP